MKTVQTSKEFRRAIMNAGCDIRVIKDSGTRFTRHYIINNKTGDVIAHLTVHRGYERDKQQ